MGLAKWVGPVNRGSEGVGPGSGAWSVGVVSEPGGASGQGFSSQVRRTAWSLC